MEGGGCGGWRVESAHLALTGAAEPLISAVLRVHLPGVYRGLSVFDSVGVQARARVDRVSGFVRGSVRQKGSG